MTPAQLTTLKAAIIADATAGPMRLIGDTASLLGWCNGPSATSAWRIRVSGSEVYDAHKPVDYIARSVGERSAFDLMAEPGRVHDFGVAAKRNGVADIFSGATNNNSRTLIFAVAKEFATNAQMTIGGANVSTGGTAGMAETETAFKRTCTDLVTQTEANMLVA